MSTGATVAIVVVALIVVVLIAALVTRGGVTSGISGIRGMRGIGGVGAGQRLKHRFGPEYDRVLERHDGDVKATRAELAERVRLHGDLDLRPVSAQERERYGARWTALQARFVDSPAQAVAEADTLIGGLAAERGFPGADTPEHFDALSVHHPHAVQSYRRTHALVGGTGEGPGQAPGRKPSTEDLRKALLSVRDLFDDLVREGGRGTRAVEPWPAADDDPDSGVDKTSALRGRFAALTGARRNQSSESSEHL